MEKRMSKRAASLAVNIIIIIAIGLIILFFFFVATGRSFGSLSDYTSSGKSNLDAIVNGCKVACLTGEPTSLEAWCGYRPTTVKFGKDDARFDGKYSCSQLVGLVPDINLLDCAGVVCTSPPFAPPVLTESGAPQNQQQAGEPAPAENLLA